MSTIDTPQSLPVLIEAQAQNTAKFGRANAPIVPPGSVTGRSLTLVIAIMAFLASLTASGVYVIFNAASVWTNNISSEVTVQVQSRGGDIGDAKIAEIVKFLSEQVGIKHVRPLSREQSLKLVEPWIGKSDVLKNFAIPRLIEVETERDNPPEIGTLKKVMETKYPGAILDDHGLWRAEIHRLTRFLELAGITMLFLMAAATAAVIIAAATSAMASNKEIVAVLNLVGAEEKFIAKQFERHFLKVGIKAGVVGAGMAGFAFLALPYISERMSSTVAAEAEIRRLVGAGSLDIGGYAVLVIVVVAVAAICKMTSRYGVRRILNQQNA
ncbi:MAG: cell division protein FtsX [Rhodomicrobium sp.]